MINTRSTSPPSSRGASGTGPIAVPAPEKADLQWILKKRAVEMTWRTLSSDLKEELFRKIEAVAQIVRGDVDSRREDGRRSANDLRERLKHPESFQMDYKETHPHQVAELRKDLNGAMESRATLSQQMDLLLLCAGNHHHSFEGSNPLKEGEHETPCNAPGNVKYCRATRHPSQGLSDSDT